MPLPDFTPDEKYVIAYAKSSAASGFNPFMWGYLIPAALMFGFAASFNYVPLMVIAFILVCGFRVYEELQQRKWALASASIMEKFEAAASGTRHNEP